MRHERRARSARKMGLLLYRYSTQIMYCDERAPLDDVGMLHNIWTALRGAERVDCAAMWESGVLVCVCDMRCERAYRV